MSTASKTTTIGTGRHLELVADNNGWEYVRRPGISGIVVIVATTDDNRLVLIEQHRPPVGRPVIELPAGLAGDITGQEDEPLTAAAQRELVEETGYQATSMRQLTAGPVSAGLTSEVITLLRAEGLRKVGDGGGDASESITVHEVPVDEVVSWLEKKGDAGAAIDLKVYAGLYFI